MKFLRKLELIKEEVRELYRADNVPWIIGYSGGKDSTAVVQIAWESISGLPVEERHKEVHIISTDTRVENPIVSEWVERSHATMRQKADAFQMPFVPHGLKPDVSNSYWTNLMGRGFRLRAQIPLVYGTYED